MRNKYTALFKDMTIEQWKLVRDKYTDLDEFRQYIHEEIPYTTLRYYDKKFGYSPVPKNHRKELGNKYGHLTVIEYVGSNSSNNTLWKCKCDCGNEVIRNGGELHRERTIDHMCPECLKKKVSQRFWKDLTGQTINELLVLERIGTTEQGNVKYKCKCLNCGNILSLSSTVLGRKNPQISCGCINSQGEYLINKVLTDLNIIYKTQYKIPGCEYINPLRFDFAIFDNEKLVGLIEFQGKQHYTDEEIQWDGYDLVTAQLRDNIKRTFCAEHNLPLIEIPYYDLSKINKAYLLQIINSFKIQG